MLAILPNLFISDSYVAQDKFLMSYWHITHVISFDRAGLRFPDIPESNVIRLDVNDAPNENIIQYFKVVNNEILKVLSSGGKVLICSAKGTGRCCTIAIAFLMQYYRFTFPSALEHVKLKQPATDIINYVNQLHQFEYELSQMETD
jgi:protein-tyrosine phosphatase